MNLLALKCQDNSTLLGDCRIPLPPIPTVPPQIVLGVRPEHLQLEPPADLPAIQGKVYLVENLGGQNLISVRVASAGGESDSLTVRVLLPADRTWSGQEIALRIPAQSIHWFDVRTGHRLKF